MALNVVLVRVGQALGMSRAQSSLAFSMAMRVEGLMAFPVGRWVVTAAMKAR